ncbi:MAG: hypothetical protein CMF62_02525 [Magnetococcales bacterium]|nr:hypothetical protein [Magnetococcales bacterium]|tara:strand:- start:2862 stop:3764 length:903 start_codon:yes stop_codon:yes gene_type:complete
MFSSFREQRDKFNSLFTIVVRNIDYEDLLDKLKHQLSLINSIKDKFKKKYLNDRLYSLIENLESIITPPKTFNKIYLVGSSLHEFNITDEQNTYLTDWNIKDFIFRSGEYFDIDYLEDILENYNYKNVIEINNNNVEHSLITKEKRKRIFNTSSKEFKLDEYLDTIKDFCVVHGVSSLIKNCKNDKHHLLNKKLEKETIFEIFDKDITLKNFIKLDMMYSHIKNEKMMNRVIFKKNIPNAIKNFLVKELYVSSEMFDKVKNKFSSEELNFEIIEIKTLENGDSGDILKKDYNGVIGLSYY